MASRSSELLRTQDHWTLTRPFRLDNAPYFAALVASSWSTIDTVRAASFSNVMLGPLISVLSFAYGANSRCTISSSDAPHQLFLLSSSWVLAKDRIRLCTVAAKSAGDTSFRVCATTAETVARTFF